MSGEYASVGTEASGVRDRAYAAPEAGLGWLSFAVVMLLIAGTRHVIYGIAAIWADTQWGRWLGVLLAGSGATLQLLFMPAAPFLAPALFAVAVLIVYGLVAHGGRREATY
jgi:hypothetical protein